MCIPERDDRGAGMIMVLAVISIFTTLALSGSVMAINARRGVDSQRSGISSVAAAEAGVDTTYQLLKVGTAVAGCTVSGGKSVWQVPSTSMPGGKPVSSRYGGQVVFYDAAGMTGTTTACTAPVRAVVRVIGSYEGRSGLTASGDRAVESLVNLEPIVNGGLGAAIYSKSGMSEGNNFELYGSTSSINDANVYVENGDFVCSNNGPIASGSVIVARGSFQSTNGCKPDVRGDLLVRDNIVSAGGLTVSGNAAANGSAAGCQATIGKKLFTVTVTAPPASCAAAGGRAAGPYTIPDTTSFPTIEYVEGDWTAQQYVRRFPAGTCPTRSELEAVTAKAVFVVPSCDMPALDVALKGDVAIFARSFDFNKVDWTATSARRFHAIVPASAAPSCPTSSPGRNISFAGTTFSSVISTFFYTPCTLSFANQMNLSGQVYAGSFRSDNKLTLKFSPPGVPGVALGGGTPQTTGEYNVDVVYKREAAGSAG